jgi:hypothetical protein
VDELSYLSDIGLEANTEFVGTVTFCIVMKFGETTVACWLDVSLTIGPPMSFRCCAIVSGMIVTCITNNATKSDEDFIEIGVGFYYHVKEDCATNIMIQVNTENHYTQMKEILSLYVKTLCSRAIPGF